MAMERKDIKKRKSMVPKEVDKEAEKISKKLDKKVLGSILPPSVGKDHYRKEGPT